MKPRIFIFLLVLSLCSCSEDVIQTQLVQPKSEQNQQSLIRDGFLKSSSLPDNLDWSGIPVYLYPVRGLTSENKFLSARFDGKKVDLYKTDDKSGRQKWVLSKLPDGTYNVSIYSGVSTERQYLSSTSTGTKVDLWGVDDASGRQRWSFLPLGNDLYSIVIGGGVTSSRRYLSCTSDGSTVDLYDKDDNTGRQQWKMEVADEFDLVGITYSLSPDDIVSSIPSYYTTILCNNSTSLQQNMTAHFSQKAIETSTFSQSYGITISVSANVKVGVPILSGGIKTDITTSANWTLGQSSQLEDQRSYDFPLNIAPYSSYSVTAVVSMCKISANYEATFISRTTKTIKKVRGKWNGIKATQITYDIKDLNIGKQLIK